MFWKLKHDTLVAEYDRIDRRIYQVYNKVCSVMNSCTTKEQLDTTFCWAMRMWVLNRRMLRLANERIHRDYNLDYAISWHKYHKALDNSNDAMLNKSISELFKSRIAELEAAGKETVAANQ